MPCPRVFDMCAKLNPFFSFLVLSWLALFALPAMALDKDIQAQCSKLVLKLLENDETTDEEDTAGNVDDGNLDGPAKYTSSNPELEKWLSDGIAEGLNEVFGGGIIKDLLAGTNKSAPKPDATPEDIISRLFGGSGDVTEAEQQALDRVKGGLQEDLRKASAELDDVSEPDTLADMCLDDILEEFGFAGYIPELHRRLKEEWGREWDIDEGPDGELGDGDIIIGADNSGAPAREETEAEASTAATDDVDGAGLGEEPAETNGPVDTGVIDFGEVDNPLDDVVVDVGDNPIISADLDDLPSDSDASGLPATGALPQQFGNASLMCPIVRETDQVNRCEHFPESIRGECRRLLGRRDCLRAEHARGSCEARCDAIVAWVNAGEWHLKEARALLEQNYQSELFRASSRDREGELMQELTELQERVNDMKLGRLVHYYENVNTGQIVQHFGEYFDPVPPLVYRGNGRLPLNARERKKLEAAQNELEARVKELSDIQEKQANPSPALAKWYQQALRTWSSAETTMLNNCPRAELESTVAQCLKGCAEGLPYPGDRNTCFLGGRAGWESGNAKIDELNEAIFLRSVFPPGHEKYVDDATYLELLYKK